MAPFYVYLGMAKSRRKATHTGASPGNKAAYISKRTVQRAISKGTRHISEEVMAKRGYIVTAHGDRVVKVFKDGQTEDMGPL